MSRKIFIVLSLALLLLAVWTLWAPDRTTAPTPTVRSCIERARQMAASWKTDGTDATTIDTRFQIELAKCSGVNDVCAPLVAATNADLAWLGRAVLSGSMAPGDYLARVRDRTRKMRESRRIPSSCEAYARGDEDADLVPDDRDQCLGTPNLAPTNARGCPDTATPPSAPSAEAVQQAAEALEIPLSRACMDSPLPERASVLKAGLAPDQRSFLIVVSRVENQPAACQLFYELDIRIRNVSFFNQLNVTTTYRKVFEASDSIAGPLAGASGMTFQLLKTDANVPWAYLTFQPVEPNEISQRHFRVRTVNASGSSRGWGASTLVPSTSFP